MAPSENELDTPGIDLTTQNADGRPATWVSPGSLLEIKKLRHHLRPSESESAL